MYNIYNILWLLLVYVIQTNILGRMPVRPDLFLVFFVILVSTKKISYSLFWGLIFGLFQDIFSGYTFFNTCIYLVLGLVYGYMPQEIFRDNWSLAVLNIITGTLLVQGWHAFLFGVFQHEYLFLPFWSLAALLLLNLFTFYIVARIFSNLWRTDV